MWDVGWLDFGMSELEEVDWGKVSWRKGSLSGVDWMGCFGLGWKYWDIFVLFLKCINFVFFWLMFWLRSFGRKVKMLLISFGWSVLFVE